MWSVSAPPPTSLLPNFPPWTSVSFGCFSGIGPGLIRFLFTGRATLLPPPEKLAKRKARVGGVRAGLGSHRRGGWLDMLCTASRLCASEPPPCTQGRGALPQPPEGTHAHAQFQGEVIEVSSFHVKKGHLLLRECIHRTWENSSALGLPIIPRWLFSVGGSPHSFCEAFVSICTALGAPRLSPLLKPLPKTLFTLQRDARQKVVGSLPPPPPWPPDSQEGGLKNPPSGFLLKPKEIGEQLGES